MSNIQEIDAKTLHQWLQAGEAVLIDVREPVEYNEEHIAGSQLFSLSQFKPADVLATKQNKKLVLHCRSGKRSMKAAEQLVESGCVEVYSLQNGIVGWVEAGFPVEKSTAPNQPISLMRQVLIVAGFFVLLGVLLGYGVCPWCFLISGFFGAGLMFAGITDTCMLGMMLAKLPHNQKLGTCSPQSCQPKPQENK